MNRLIISIFIAFLVLAPRAVFADNGASPASCSVSTLDDFYCTCTTPTSPIYEEAESVEACNSACGAFPEATSWKLEQCLINDDGSVFVDPVDQDVVTGDATEYTEPAKVEKADPVYPALNVDIPGLDPKTDFVVSTEDGNIASNFIGVYITKLYSWLIGAATLVAVTMMMIGGMQYAFARGKAQLIDAAKKRISNAITGLVLLLAAYNIAFLINPDLVVLGSLTVPYVKGLEYFPPEGEDIDVTPNTTLTGQTSRITGEYISADSTMTVDADALAALQSAALAFHSSQGKSIVISSATRDLTKQATLFYSNCIKTGGVCSIPTCNPASSSVISVSRGRYALAGTLLGSTSGSEIVSGIAASADYGSCPHTSGIALDAWCGDGGSNYQHDPTCQDALIQVMISKGFCRLSSEVWHFEFNTKKVSSKCSTGNNNISYTTKAGNSYTPGADCRKWDFKNHFCTIDR
ncbi:MAG: pilin [Candidatus Uhrbacteria bacterium]|nr:pilin [Candidatus Uhrbacteria bacterium]